MKCQVSEEIKIEGLRSKPTAPSERQRRGNHLRKHKAWYITGWPKGYSKAALTRVHHGGGWDKRVSLADVVIHLGIKPPIAR